MTGMSPKVPNSWHCLCVRARTPIHTHAHAHAHTHWHIQTDVALTKRISSKIRALCLVLSHQKRILSNLLCVLDLFVAIFGKGPADCKLILGTMSQLHAELCQHFDVTRWHQFSDCWNFSCVVRSQYQQHWSFLHTLCTFSTCSLCGPAHAQNWLDVEWR